MTNNEFKAAWEKTYDIDGYKARKEAQWNLRKEYNSGMKVGDKGSVRLWSDSNPCTVIRRTKTTVTVRFDKAELNPEWKPEWVVGGFSAICTNQKDQQWIIEDDPEGSTETFRWSDKENCFIHNGCRLTPGWYKHYDYNF
jgi:hypothetical protein